MLIQMAKRIHYDLGNTNEECSIRLWYGGLILTAVPAILKALSEYQTEKR